MDKQMRKEYRRSLICEEGADESLDIDDSLAREVDDGYAFYEVGMHVAHERDHLRTLAKDIPLTDDMSQEDFDASSANLMLHALQMEEAVTLGSQAKYMFACEKVITHRFLDVNYHFNVNAIDSFEKKMWAIGVFVLCVVYMLSPLKPWVGELIHHDAIRDFFFQNMYVVDGVHITSENVESMHLTYMQEVILTLRIFFMGICATFVSVIYELLPLWLFCVGWVISKLCALKDYLDDLEDDIDEIYDAAKNLEDYRKQFDEELQYVSTLPYRINLQNYNTIVLQDLKRKYSDDPTSFRKALAIPQTLDVNGDYIKFTFVLSGTTRKFLTAWQDGKFKQHHPFDYNVNIFKIIDDWRLESYERFAAELVMYKRTLSHKGAVYSLATRYCVRKCEHSYKKEYGVPKFKSI